MNKQTGFTLIELMVAIAIFAILMAVGIPGLRTLQNNSVPETFAERLIRSLAQAREEGSRLADDNNAIVCRSTDGSACNDNDGSSWAIGWIFFIDANGDNNPQAGEVQWVENVSTLGIVFNNARELPERIGFNGFGRTLPNNDNSVVFEICGPDRNKSAKKTVIVSNSGSISKTTGDGECSAIDAQGQGEVENNV